MDSINRKNFFCSWSGGKDSCLALYRSIKNGGNPKALLTMMVENGKRSRSHGLPHDVIQSQADALGIPSLVRSTSWDDYEQTFVTTLKHFKEQNIEHGVFGDIDLAPHLEWVERVCSSVGIQAYEPLWQTARQKLLDEFLQLGFKSTIVAIKQDALDNSFLGRTLDKFAISDLKNAGIDASGEEGEYHTIVTDGPIFSRKLDIELNDEVVRNGYSFLDISLAKV
jgi:diphthine-ammonia ligase